MNSFLKAVGTAFLVTIFVFVCVITLYVSYIIAIGLAICLLTYVLYVYFSTTS